MSSSDLSSSTQRLSLTDIDLLMQISSMLTTLDRDHVLQQVIALATKAVGAERSSLLLHPDHRDDWMPLILERQPHSDSLERLDARQPGFHLAKRVLDQGLAGWALRNRQAALVTDTKTDERWVDFPDSTSQARSALAVPFIYEGEVLGVLTMLHTQPKHFTTHDLQLLTIIVNQATVAIRNAQLFHRLGQQKRQLEAILRAMPDILLVLDDQGRLMLINDAAANLLAPELPLAEFEKRKLTDFIDSGHVLWAVQEIINQPGNSTVWSFEVRSSAHHDYLGTVAIWTTEPAGASGYVVILRDITTLRDLNRFKDEMLQMASHDLRSPLALIVGYCDLIAMDTPAESHVHEYLDIIQRSTERMSGLLDDLLKVEQIRNSPLELNEQVDFTALVQTAIANTRSTADNKRQQLNMQIELQDLPAFIVLNPVLIREAMENLITNAIKYTTERGTITVRAWVDAGRVHFEVEDTGIGIPKAALSRLFESFYRVKQKGTEKIEGRGLGLSLVKTVVERHQGQVWVESEVGIGSKFGFWLPIVVR